MKSRWLVLGALVLAWGRPAGACSLCDPRLAQAPTFRNEAARPIARVIVLGTITKAELVGDGGRSVLQIKAVLKDDPFLKGKKSVELPRYLPKPSQWLVFCDLFMGKLDPYRGVPIKTDTALDYVKKAPALNPKDSTGNLLFFFRHLDDPDPEAARDAYLEFAKAGDAEVAAAARKPPAAKLRGWLKDPATPP